MSSRRRRRPVPTTATTTTYLAAMIVFMVVAAAAFVTLSTRVHAVANAPAANVASSGTKKGSRASAATNRARKDGADETDSSSPTESELRATKKRTKKTDDVRKTRSVTGTAPPTPPSQRRRSDRVRRLVSEWKDLVKSGHAYRWQRGKALNHTAGTYFVLGPLTDSLLVWHFSLCGPPDSAFADGLYHGRIVVPSDYPARPPSVQVWTPSGRFVPFRDICLSASPYHPEEWNPSQWSLRTLVEGLRLHFLTAANEIAGRNDPYEQRLEYAAKSREWKCRISNTNIVVNHDKMIRQGIFRGYLSTTKDEGGAIQDETADIRKRGDDNEQDSRTGSSKVDESNELPDVYDSNCKVETTTIVEASEEKVARSRCDRIAQQTKTKKAKHKNKKEMTRPHRKPAFVLGALEKQAANAVAMQQQQRQQQRRRSSTLSVEAVCRDFVRKHIRLTLFGLFLALFLYLNRG